VAAGSFATWVACLTKDGCPVPSDPRYDSCQNILPPEVTDLIDACRDINAWTKACAGKGPAGIPVNEISFTECLAQAQPFSVVSYIAYADCTTTAPCDDIAARVTCYLSLRFRDRSRITQQCKALVGFANSCGSDLGGGSTPACEAIFATFTPASLDEFIACVKANPCGDAPAATECARSLEIQ